MGHRAASTLQVLFKGVWGGDVVGGGQIHIIKYKIFYINITSITHELHTFLEIRTHFIKERDRFLSPFQNKFLELPKIRDL